jgi:hypothetical protein
VFPFSVIRHCIQPHRTIKSGKSGISDTGGTYREKEATPPLLRKETIYLAHQTLRLEIGQILHLKFETRNLKLDCQSAR